MSQKGLDALNMAEDKLTDIREKVVDIRRSLDIGFCEARRIITKELEEKRDNTPSALTINKNTGAVSLNGSAQSGWTYLTYDNFRLAICPKGTIRVCKLKSKNVKIHISIDGDKL